MDIFVALISEGKDRKILYHYDDRRNYQFIGPIEEKHTLELSRENEELKIKDYPVDHTVKIIPMFKANIILPSEEFNNSIEFSIHEYRISIQGIVAKGGEGIIYRGLMNSHPMIFKVYTRLAFILRSLPPELRVFVPKKHLLFLDGSARRRYVVAMDTLYVPVFSKKIMKQSLQFISIMEELNEVHGDISPGNIMMDSEGNVKFIDFSRSKRNLGTPFYSKNHKDRAALALVLLGLKYNKLIRSLINNDDIPLHKYTLHKLFKWYNEKNGPITEKEFMEWFNTIIPQDEENKLLIEMALQV